MEKYSGYLQQRMVETVTTTLFLRQAVINISIVSDVAIHFMDFIDFDTVAIIEVTMVMIMKICMIMVMTLMVIISRL